MTIPDLKQQQCFHFINQTVEIKLLQRDSVLFGKGFVFWLQITSTDDKCKPRHLLLTSSELNSEQSLLYDGNYFDLLRFGKHMVSMCLIVEMKRTVLIRHAIL